NTPGSPSLGRPGYSANLGIALSSCPLAGLAPGMALRSARRTLSPVRPGTARGSSGAAIPPGRGAVPTASKPAQLPESAGAGPAAQMIAQFWPPRCIALQAQAPLALSRRDDARRSFFMV